MTGLLIQMQKMVKQKTANLRTGFTGLPQVADVQAAQSEPLAFEKTKTWLPGNS
jgi:hypothetical protein